jgi:hypothetical protein
MSSSSHSKAHWRTGGSTTVLPQLKKDARCLRLATLSFRLDGEHGGLAPGILTGALSATFGGRRARADLILVAGHSLASEPKPSAVLRASAGAPVLLEVRDRPGGPARWVLFARNLSGAKAIVREDQIVRHRGSPARAFNTLRSVAFAGKGHVVFDRTGVRAVLLICGENNALSRRNQTSVLRGRRTRSAYSQPRDKQPPLLAGEWLVLNPAHAAYEAVGTTYAGWGKVAWFRRKRVKYPPLLREWTKPLGKCYRDGSRDPFAILHANNFTGSPATRTLASRLFVRGRGKTGRVLSGPREQNWYVVTYDVAVSGKKGDEVE